MLSVANMLIEYNIQHTNSCSEQIVSKNGGLLPTGSEEREVLGWGVFLFQNFPLVKI